MTPARSNSSKRNSPSGFKPYTRGVAPIIVSSAPDVKPSAGTNAQAGLRSSSPTLDPAVDQLGFPTYAQYKQVEAAYIQSLTPRRQGKALISQDLFDRVWDVLHDPDIQGETAQFRFWARKMFTLSRTYRSTLNPLDKDPPQEVLLHDGLLVAVKEQLYDLLCYCHGIIGHGGRDKTCGLIRKHYTWVPKDLVSNFIKACPTCILKKSPSAFVFHMPEHKEDDEDCSHSPDLFADYGSSADSAASVAPPAFPVAASSTDVPSPTLASCGDSEAQEMEEVDPIEIAYREAVRRARNLKASLRVSGMAVARPPAMSRDLPLYENGWQYRHKLNYASSHAEFLKTKDLGLVQDDASGAQVRHPRVPSPLPLWSSRFMRGEYSDHDADLSRSTPPLMQASQSDSGIQDDCSLQYLLGHPQPSLVDFKEDSEPQHFVQQIDPSLLQRSASQGHSNVTKAANQAVNAGNNTSFGLKRAAAPPRLEIDFSTYRTGLREADATPDSPLNGINWDQAVNPSPTRSGSSSSSGGSQLSAFAVPPPMSATTTVSSASSTLRTPVDEFPDGTNKGDHVRVGVMKGKAKAQLGEIELIDGIEQVCGL